MIFLWATSFYSLGEILFVNSKSANLAEITFVHPTSKIVMNLILKTSSFERISRSHVFRPKNTCRIQVRSIFFLKDISFVGLLFVDGFCFSILLSSNIFGILYSQIWYRFFSEYEIKSLPTLWYTIYFEIYARVWKQ